MCCCCSYFQLQCLLSLSAGCKKHSALKDLRNSAIVLNLNGFRAQHTDGCVHSQIWRSIVQNPLFSLSNRILSFSHCCLLRPLYHSAPLHTLCMYAHKTHPEAHTVLLFFILSLSLSPSPGVASLSLSSVPPFSTPPFLFSQYWRTR